MVVEGDGHPRIELLRTLILGDGRGEIIVQEMQIAQIDVCAGRVAQLERSAVVDRRLRLVSFLQ